MTAAHLTGMRGRGGILTGMCGGVSVMVGVRVAITVYITHMSSYPHTAVASTSSRPLTPRRSPLTPTSTM